MAVLVWNSNWDIGIDSIDNEHKKLIGLINRLQAGGVLPGKREVDAVLTELMDYTVYHFANEEKLFKKYAYPDAAAHVKAHMVFTDRIAGLCDVFDKGSTAVGQEAVDFLRDWLVNHIILLDKKYALFLSRKNINQA
ncbi:MAG: bacteriohemerythrin [Candidatus Omnitrophota bacterium]